MSLIDIVLLYLCFRLKQVSCDFFLNSSWMALNRGKKGLEGYLPLAAHAGIHALGTLIIMLVFVPTLWWMAVVDFFLHGLIDRIKAVLSDHKKWTHKDKAYWVVFGIDQEAHNLTHLAYILIVIMALGGVQV